jgi:type II secretory pathway component PulF
MIHIRRYIGFARCPRLFQARRQRQAWLEVCDALALLVDAGLTLPQAFRHIEQTARSHLARAIAGDLANEVTEGRSLTQYRQYGMPELLRLFFLASESSGTLALSVRRWVDLVQQQKAWMNALVRLLVYPALVLASTLLLFVFLWMKVLPTFNALRDLVSVQPSQAAIWIERTIRWGGYLCLLATSCALGLFAWLLWARSKSPCAWERVVLGGPVRHVALAYRTRLFCQFLGALLDAGVPVIDALSVLGKAGQPHWLRSAAAECEQRLLSGEGLAKAFGSRWHPLFTQALTSAEQTGDLCGGLFRIEPLLHALVLKEVQRWLRILQPVLIAGAGLMVAACMALLYVPMYDVIGQISGGGM